MDNKLNNLESAWQTIITALDAALRGNFPVGLNHVSYHADLYNAATVISSALKEKFEPKPDCKDCKDE